MECWWVNQNQTYRYEVEGGYMWSPKTTINGSRNQFYDNMTKTSIGDVVFSFKDTFIKAIGIVIGNVETAPKPIEFDAVENPWSDDGWYVPVSYTEIRPTLPEKYSPLQQNGNGVQTVYLAHVPEPMANILIKLLGNQVDQVITAKSGEEIVRQLEDDNHESEIEKESELPETERSQLIKARRGQGVFRDRVSSIENKCRVTGVSSLQHLRASHIKPWRLSEKHEKLDGANGLMLSPHVDHLFDRGYITFTQDGSLLISPKLGSDILDSWDINQNLNVGPFTSEQERYLLFHRELHKFAD